MKPASYNYIYRSLGILKANLNPKGINKKRSGATRTFKREQTKRTIILLEILFQLRLHWQMRSFEHCEKATG